MKAYIVFINTRMGVRKTFFYINERDSIYNQIAEVELGNSNKAGVIRLEEKKGTIQIQEIEVECDNLTSEYIYNILYNTKFQETINHNIPKESIQGSQNSI